MLEELGAGEKAYALYLALLLLMLLAGALTVRRIALRRVGLMAMGWVAIFGLLFAAVVFWEQLRGPATALQVAANPAGGALVKGEFMVRASEDGHFYVRGAVNGESVLFLVDTGASDIVLSIATADRVGLDHSRLKFDGQAATANGMVPVAAARLDRLAVGPIERRNVQVAVNGGAIDVNLLGMSFLRSLRGWRVEGDRLYLIVS